MNARTLSVHILHIIATAERAGRSMNLELLTAELHVRRADVRRTVTALDREGFVDAMRMRLTLAGFALARSVGAYALPTLHRGRGKSQRKRAANASATLAA